MMTVKAQSANDLHQSSCIVSCCSSFLSPCLLFFTEESNRVWPYCCWTGLSKPRVEHNFSRVEIGEKEKEMDIKAQMYAPELSVSTSWQLDLLESHVWPGQGTLSWSLDCFRLDAPRKIASAKKLF